MIEQVSDKFYFSNRTDRDVLFASSKEFPTNREYPSHLDRKIAAGRCSLKQCEFSASRAIDPDKFPAQLLGKKSSTAPPQSHNKNEKPAIHRPCEKSRLGIPKPPNQHQSKSQKLPAKVSVWLDTKIPEKQLSRQTSAQ